MGILDLPDELLVAILSNLDAVSFRRCKLVCKLFMSLIDDSTVLRYIIALNDAGYIDGPSTCTISTAERLRRLEHHQAAWRDLNWSRTDSYDIDHRTGTYELYGGVYAQGLESTIDATSDGTRGLELIEFPSALRNQPEGHRWRIPDFGFDVKDFGMDPDKDLLILMRKPPRPSAKIRNPPLEVHLVCLRDPDARPHPLAQHPVLFYQPHVWNRRYYYWIQVVGDLLGVMFRPEVRNQDDAMAHELLDELIVWKWKTGEQVTRIRCDPGFEAGSFSFLTNEVILIPCVKDDIVPELRLYQLPRKTSTASTKDSASNSQASTLLAIFRFPEFIRSVRACGIVCRTDPSPWVPEPRRPADVHDAFESSERDHDVPVWPAHGAAPFAPHPSSRLVVISMDIVTMVRWPGWGILPNVEGDMGQQPMGRKHTFFTRAESLIEAWKMASEKLEGEGVADVPWEDWGPAGTRMLGEGTDPSAVCYVYGLRYIRLVAMGDGDPRTVYIRVMDFNDTDFDRAYYEDALSQRRAAAGVEEGSRVSVEADGSEEGSGASEAPEARPQMETNEKNTSDGVDETQELPDEEVDEDEMIMDDDGDEDWVDEDVEGGNIDDDDDEELELDVDDDPDARRTSEQRTRDAIEGFGSLCVIDKVQKAQCERTKVALHESYVEDVFVYKQRITTSLPFRWSFKTEPEIQRWTACMMDDEHIIGLKAS